MATPVFMFMNMKGGVGKTALAVNLAYEVGYYYDKNALLIDFDPQANASLAVMGPGSYFKALGQGKSLASVMMPGVSPTDPFNVIQAVGSAAKLGDVVVGIRSWYLERDGVRTDAGLVDLVPGDLDLMRLAMNRLSDSQEKRLMGRWQHLIRQARSQYDCVIVDCHPAGSFFTKAAILESNAVIVPVTTDGYAEAGLNMMGHFIDSWIGAGGAKHYYVAFNDAQNEWDDATENTIRQDKRYANLVLSPRIPHSRLIRNVGQRQSFVREQKVAYRWAVSRVLNRLTRNLVSHLKDDNVIDASWESQR